MVADDARVDEAAQVELLRPEHGHLGGWFLGRSGGGGLVRRSLCVYRDGKISIGTVDVVVSGVMTQRLITCRARRVLNLVPDPRSRRSRNVRLLQ